MARKSDSGAESSEMSIRKLISYRLSRAASLMSRGAALRYRRECDVSLGEWRAIALLADLPSPGLLELAREAGLDKAQMSRVISSLLDRGLVTREPSPAGRRAIELDLSDEGEKEYAKLIAAAQERDEAFRNALTKQELDVLLKALDTLSDVAKEFIRKEHEEAEAEG